MRVLDVKGKNASIVILNEATVEEFYNVGLPKGVDQPIELARLKAGGFKTSYSFRKNVVDRRSLTLAKAQAASIAQRIRAKTGVGVEVSRLLVVTG